MPPKTLFRVGLGLFLIAALIYSCTAYWFKTSIFVPLDIFVSLATRQIKSPPFQVNLRSNTASALRPDDPLILNNEGLSLSKAGDFAGAEKVYRRALQIMGATGVARSINYSTTTNNLAATLAYQGNFEDADKLFDDALQLRRSLLKSDDPKIAIGLNNVAAMRITEGRCAEAAPFLDEAIGIQRANRESVTGPLSGAYDKALAGAPNLLSAVPTPRGLAAVPPDPNSCVAVAVPPNSGFCTERST